MRHSLALAAASAFALTLAASAAHASSVFPLGLFRTLSGQATFVIGHRGAAAYLPENSLGGYELAAAQGADYVETDVHLSSDGVAIVMHDATLKRTTNVEDLFAPRNEGYAVADFTAAEIGMLTTDPSGPAGTTYPGFTPVSSDPYKVPTFAAFLDTVSATNAAAGTSVGVVVEVKGEYDPTINRQIVSTLAEKGFTSPEAKVVLQSFSYENTEELARLASEAGLAAETSQLAGPATADGAFGVANANVFRSLTSMSSYLDSVGVFRNAILTEEFVQAAHALGLGVNVWTLRPRTLEEAFAQIDPLIAMGVDGIITDYPDYAREVVDAAVLAAVPLPATLPLLAGGAMLLGGVARRRRTRAS